MDAMLLAAGRGERMRPLSDLTPKPLLKVHDKPLIVWQIQALARAGFKRIVINHAWLGHQLEQSLGDGARFGVEIVWSPETVALGTAGGIVKALSQLHGDIFLVASADIYTDFDYSTLLPFADLQQGKDLAHLVLVNDQRVRQDFDLKQSRVVSSETPSLTYGNMGLFHRRLFDGLIADEASDLGVRLREAVKADQLSGQQHLGRWDNVGTPTDLDRVNAEPILRS